MSNIHDRIHHQHEHDQAEHARHIQDRNAKLQELLVPSFRQNVVNLANVDRLISSEPELSIEQLKPVSRIPLLHRGAFTKAEYEHGGHGHHGDHGGHGHHDSRRFVIAGKIGGWLIGPSQLPTEATHRTEPPHVNPSKTTRDLFLTTDGTFLRRREVVPAYGGNNTIYGAVEGTGTPAATVFPTAAESRETAFSYFNEKGYFLGHDELSGLLSLKVRSLGSVARRTFIL